MLFDPDLEVDHDKFAENASVADIVWVDDLAKLYAPAF